MADLLRMLGFASRSLEAQRFGLDVAGQNIANVNTAGYTRRVLDLGSVPPVDPYSAGGGVEVLGVRSMRDQLLARRLLGEYPAEQRERAVADALGIVEVALGTAGHSIDGSLDDFFDAWAGVADAPTSATARQEVVLQGEALATAFHEMSDRFDAAMRDTDARVRATVEEINRLAGRVASLNLALSGTSASSGSGLYLRDEIAKTVEQLSGLVDINAVPRPEGGFDIELAGTGRPLAIGENAYALEVRSQDGTGLAEIWSGGRLVGAPGSVEPRAAAVIRGGTLGGLLEVRDTYLPSYREQLDALAYSVATRVNAQHNAGLGVNEPEDAPPTDFFADLASAAGAARAIARSPGLTADTVAARARSGDPLHPTGIGDNANARLLAALRDTAAAGSTETFNDSWAKLVYGVGRDAGAAKDALASRGEVVAQIRNLQDSVSGVSLDEEAADLLRFQRAYQANARYFRAIDDTLALLMQTFGG